MPELIKSYCVERKKRVVKKAVKNPYTGEIVEPEELEEYGPHEVVEYEQYVGDARKAAAMFPYYHLKREDAEKYAKQANAEMKATEKLAAKQAAKAEQPAKGGKAKTDDDKPETPADR